MVTILIMAAKVATPGLRRLGILQNPNGLGFQVKELIVTNLKVGQNFFRYPCLGFFLKNHPLV